MEPPKRRKLEVWPSSSTSAVSSTYDPTQIINALKVFRSEPAKTHAELIRLKKHLDSKEHVLAFLEHDNKTAYRALLTHIGGVANEVFMLQHNEPTAAATARRQCPSAQTIAILRETYSVVANMCHLSVTACIEACSSYFDILCRVFVHVLRPKQQAEEQVLSTLRCPVLRLIGNLCELKETATYVAISAPLMDLVALSVARSDEGDDNNDETKTPLLLPPSTAAERRQEEEQALRVLRLLTTRRKHLKYVLRCNGLAKIAVFIVRRHRCGDPIFTGRPDVLQLLTCVLRVYATQVGDQLTTSAECVELFLQFLLEQPRQQRHHQNAKLAHHLTELILRCVHNSHKMRYQLGQDAITAVLRSDETTLSDVHCRFLCCFLKDVHGRAWLRESGGLQRILWRLATPDQCDNSNGMGLLRLQQAVVTDLKSILHDHALSLTINHPNFLPTAIAQIHRFLEENSVECDIICDDASSSSLNASIIVAPSSLQPDAGMAQNHQREQCAIDISLQQSNEEPPLCKNFSAFYWATDSPAASPPSSSTISRNVAWSPSMSPSTSSACISAANEPPPQFASSPSASPPSDGHNWLDDYFEENLISPKAMSPPLQADMAPEELEADDPSSFMERNTITVDDEEAESDNEIFEEDMALVEDNSSASAVADRGGVSSFAIADGENSDRKSMERRRKAKKIRAKIVDALLTLITTFSHLDERQSIVLINENVIRALVRHVSEAPAMDNRLCRALRRLARHQMGLQKMLEMDFYQMIIKHLLRRKCMLTRFTQVCIRCDYRRDFGRGLLGDHAMLADSLMGEHVLLRVRLDDAAGTETGRARALAAALVLLRKDERRARFHHNFQPVDVLLELVGRLVMDTVFGNNDNDDSCSSSIRRPLDEHSEEGQLCCEMLSALSALLKSHRHIFEEAVEGPMFGSKESATSAEATSSNNLIGSVGPTGCVLTAANNINNAATSCSSSPTAEQKTLKFLDKNGTLVAQVPKRELCTYNEYFMGMFGSEFLERLTGRDQFVFDSHAECCSREEFVKFLHFSIGCGLQSECVQVTSAECCVAMLRLADKYLCTRLLDHLLQSGRASRFVTGHTLHLFLPLVLSVPAVGDAGGLTKVCALVLLRYCTDAQALRSLRELAERDAGLALGQTMSSSYVARSSLVNTLFGEALRAFLLPFASLTPPRARRGLMRECQLDASAYWDFG